MYSGHPVWRKVRWSYNTILTRDTSLRAALNEPPDDVLENTPHPELMKYRD